MIKIRFTVNRSTPRRKALIVCNVVVSVLISLGVSLPTAAITRAQLEFYAQNGIFFYNPDNTVGIDSTTCISGSNTTGTGSRVLGQEQLDFIEKLKPIYQAAASKYNFPWQILVALHYRESGLSLNAPSNGLGFYQISNSNYPTGPQSEEEFARQTEDAAAFVSNIISSYNLNISNNTDIKRVFLYYNGTGGGHYAENAVKYGYSADEPWEGSPYVMNFFDAARSPMKGGFPKDHVWDENYESKQFGTYTIYTALGGSGDDGCFFYTLGGYTMAFGASGMNEDEAVKLMSVFRDRMHEKDKAYLINTYGLTSNTCSGGIAYNCVSFSRYFVNVYTERSNNIIRDSLGNGINIAPNLISDYPSSFQSCGPQAFAVFSGKGTTDAGHTGVILGINTNAGPAGEVITGEAACGSGEGGIKVVVYSLVTFMNKYNSFACPINGVNLSVDSNYNFEYPKFNADNPINVIREAK